jgi:hypothetical protein
MHKSDQKYLAMQELSTQDLRCVCGMIDWLCGGADLNCCLNNDIDALEAGSKFSLFILSVFTAKSLLSDWRLASSLKDRRQKSLGVRFVKIQ